MEQKAAECVNKVFLSCLDSSLDRPAKEKYFGPITVPTNTVAVPTVFEYPDADFGVIDGTDDTDVRDHKFKGVVVMWYSDLRARSQGFTAPDDRFNRKPNGVWGPWSE